MSLSRRAALGGMAAALTAPRAFAAVKRQYRLEPVPVAHDMWMIEGATEYFTDANGGAIVNCALIRTEDGIVIVDSGPSRRYGEALLALANELDGNGVAAVVNTHHHPDHFLGNQVFADRPIHALPTTKAEAETHGDAFADNMYLLLGDWMRGTEMVPPNSAVEGGELIIGGRAFDLLPLAGHTAADLAMLDRTTGTLIAGDLAFLNRAPTTPSANLDVWRDSLDLLEGVGAAGVLPGHGPLDRIGDSLRQTRAYLDWLETTMSEAARSGLDMVEVMALPLPAEYAAMGAMPQEFHRSVVHLFGRIERRELPRADHKG